MPLMNSPLPTLLLSAIYLFIVGMGKTWMEHRQPMRMDRIIIVYNVLQIVTNSIFVLLVGSFVGCIEMANLILFFSYSQATYYILIGSPNFNFVCEPADFSTDGLGQLLAYVGYSYLIVKLIDYLDTVFFILRKKWGQVSFLHVYHHVSTSIVTFFILLYAPGLKISHNLSVYNHSHFL